MVGTSLSVRCRTASWVDALPPASCVPGMPTLRLRRCVLRPPPLLAYGHRARHLSDNDSVTVDRICNKIFVLLELLVGASSFSQRAR